VRVTRIGDAGSPLFLIASEGRAGPFSGAQARRRTSTIVTLLRPRMNVLAALTTRGATMVGGSAALDGADTASFVGWGCPPPSLPKPGIAIDDSSQITWSGTAAAVRGSPPVQATVTAADSMTYFGYGPGLDWNTLVGMATTVVGTGPLAAIGPTTVGGACDTANPHNWGDPATPGNPTPGVCRDHFPIIHAPYGLAVTGGRGQGILLVGGDLDVQGGFEFYGPVIVRGTLRAHASGGRFNGGVLAANVNLAQNVVVGGAMITYSSCVLARVLDGVATPVRSSARPWAELF
jgi:hypothetical protein